MFSEIEKRNEHLGTTYAIANDQKVELENKNI